MKKVLLNVDGQIAAYQLLAPTTSASSSNIVYISTKYEVIAVMSKELLHKMSAITRKEELTYSYRFLLTRSMLRFGHGVCYCLVLLRDKKWVDHPFLLHLIV